MWDEAYKLGIEQIDGQHKQLIGTLEDLLKYADDETRSAEQCKLTMSFLKEYTRNHFSAEEMLQRRIEYPYREAHHKMHEGFKEKLHEIDLELMRCGYAKDKVRELAGFLTRWWIFHIMREDKKMVAFLPQ